MSLPITTKNVTMDTKKVIQVSRILWKLNSFLEKEFNEDNGTNTTKYRIWSDRYDKIATYGRKLMELTW